MKKLFALLLVIGIAVWFSYRYFLIRPELSQAQVTIRVGYFPNLTHAPVLIGLNQGIFQKNLGPTVSIESKQFNAGPTEIEALFAGEIDIGYIGPGPAINGYVKSNGEALKIVSGVTSGGVSFIVQPELAEEYHSKKEQAFIGKIFASPQQGNTQDISLRHYLRTHGLTEFTTISPIGNADQVGLFQQKKLDGAWIPEPWASNLVLSAGGIRLIDERDLWENKSFSTTVIIVSSTFMKEHPELVTLWLKSNADVIDWIRQNDSEAKVLTNRELENLTHKKLPENVLTEAWEKLQFETDPQRETIKIFAERAKLSGFIAENSEIENIFEGKFLYEFTGKSY